MFKPRFSAARTITCAVALLIPAIAAMGCESGTTKPTADSAQAVTTASAEPEAVASADTAPAESADPEPETSAEAVADATPSTTAAAGATPPKPGTKVAVKATPTASSKPVEGKKGTGPQYAAWLQAAPSYKVGGGSVTAVVTAKGEFHINEAYPFKFKLNSPPGGLSYPAMISKAVSKTTKRATVSVPFVSSAAGAKTVSGTLHFSVCNESTCKIGKQPMSVTVNVK